MKKNFLTISFIFMAACTQMPEQAYSNRGQAENLLNATSEEVTINLNNSGGFRQLTDWVDKEQPSNAKLVCNNAKSCNKASEILDQFNIPYEQLDGNKNQVTLTFESLEARDCDNRFISNHINPYNLNHPSFGCSIAANQVQMVTNKSDFTSPKLLDQYDGQKAVQNYDSYTSREAQELNSGDFSVTK